MNYLTQCVVCHKILGEARASNDKFTDTHMVAVLVRPLRDYHYHVYGHKITGNVKELKRIQIG